MAAKPRNWGLWGKLIVGGLVISVGGPLMTNYVRPTDEELFQKYNPELKKKSLERRQERQQEFDDFVTRLKEDSKSSKPIWVVQNERAKREQDAKMQESLRIAEEVKARKDEMRREAGLSTQSKS